MVRTHVKDIQIATFGGDPRIGSTFGPGQVGFGELVAARTYRINDRGSRPSAEIWLHDSRRLRLMGLAVSDRGGVHRFTRELLRYLVAVPRRAIAIAEELHG